MEKDKPKIFEFGKYRLDIKGHQLWREKTPVSLTPKAFETLALLVRKHGELVSKDFLMDEIWKDTYVEEGSLTRNISVLRKVFAPDNFIKTIPRCGYTFDYEVSEISSEENQSNIVHKKTLAVLPFKFLTSQKEDFFGLGLTDALITKLCNLNNIEVRPTSSVLHFAESKESFMKIGEKLKVKLLIDGNVQRYNEILRVTVQLIQAEDELTIWADKFDVQYTNILTTLDSISRDIARALKIELKDSDRKKLKNSLNTNNSAYQNYLRGRYFWNKRNIESFYKAIKYFKKAIDEDPLFALAYTGVADCYNALNAYGELRPHDAFPKAKAAAEKALEIAPDLAEAHASLAYVLRSYEWDFEDAEKEFKLAIKYNSNYPSAHQWYSSLLIALERFDEGIREIETAKKLDPLSLAINASFGFASFYSRNFDKTIKENLQILEMEKDFIPSRYGLNLAYIEKQMYEEAILEMQEIVKIQAENQKWIAHLGSTYAVSGKKDKALKILSRLISESKNSYISPMDIAMIYAGLGDKDSAFQWLDKSVNEREPNLIYLKVDPEFDVLRSDKRFKKVLQQIQLV